MNFLFQLWKWKSMITFLMCLTSLSGMIMLESYKEFHINAAVGRHIQLSLALPIDGRYPEIVWHFENNVHIASINEDKRPSIYSAEFLERAEVHPDGHLIIKKLTRADSGVYTATATFHDGMRLKTIFRLHVYEPVSKPYISSNHHLDYSTGLCKVTLTCSVTGGSDVKYSWWMKDFPNEMIPSYQRIQENILVVFLKKVHRYISYHCKTTNPISEEVQFIKPYNLCWK
ncbi:SLAM family member 9-like [Protopterus annectens]|uniref:SLAM family member 9-like n=1 Tax=Protopterus annectens TaxID=7888 RepID=UPI001CFB16C8|nr:SLAM family member 9-like [Protopterus annectens]